MVLSERIKNARESAGMGKDRGGRELAADLQVLRTKPDPYYV